MNPAIDHQKNIVSNRLRGKTAVLTASTDGIGLAAARRLKQEGANVVISSRKQENVDKAVSQLKSEGLEVIGVQCHVSKSEERKNLFDTAVKHFGGIDILVSNAGVNPSIEPIYECTEEKWDKLFEVNVKANFLLMKEVLPHMRKPGGGGSIIFMTSIAAFQPEYPIGAYSVSKTAVLGLTRAAGLELAREGIRVNCYAPGPTDTKFGKVMVDTPQKLQTKLEEIPMGRLAQPEEMAGVVAFLASDDSSYMTGETIILSGGFVGRL